MGPCAEGPVSDMGKSRAIAFSALDFGGASLEQSAAQESR